MPTNSREKDLIYKSVVKAKATGEIVFAKCQKCGTTSKRLHAHHDDYSKPLDVVCLCVSCHRERHKALGWGVNGRPKLTWGYHFEVLEVGDFAILDSQDIAHISMLAHRFKRHTKRRLKCFSGAGGIVVFRIF